MLRSVEINSYFNSGFINKSINKILPYRFRGNIIIGILFAVFILQAPIFIINYFELKKYGIDMEGSFLALRDYSAYAQTLFGIPIYLAVRELVAKSWDRITSSLNEQLIEKHSLVKLDKKLKTIVKIFTSKWVEIIVVIISFSIPIATYLSEFFGSVESWYIFEISGARFMTIAGIYAWFITIPIYILLTAYWARQILLWMIMLFSISRSKIKYNALITDNYCGLGFLQDSIKAFSILIFAQGIVQIATILYKINIQGLPLFSFNVIILVISYMVIAPVLFIVPMTFFTKQIKNEKHMKLDEIDCLSRKLFASNDIKYDKLISYNDLMTARDGIQKVKVIPIDIESVSRLFLSAFVPMLPILTRFAGLDIPGWLVDVLGNI